MLKEKVFIIVSEDGKFSLKVEEGLSKLVNSSDEEKKFASKSIKRETKKVIDMLKVDKNMNNKNSDEILSILKSIQADMVQVKDDIVEIKADIVEIKDDIVEIKDDIVQLKADVKDLKERVTIIEEKLERNNIQ
ncbi:hypothetical protein [Mesoplasma seiffertii]|uniref:hypothetical protein n=1 Tax=Mesoplasma seiffertii TaxID=28224 RepID=UPI0004796011|nr:hypothetical protein [Mesoplasma seiffertii]